MPITPYSLYPDVTRSTSHVTRAEFIRGEPRARAKDQLYKTAKSSLAMKVCEWPEGATRERGSEGGVSAGGWGRGRSLGAVAVRVTG